MNTEVIKREVLKSDMMRLFIGVLLFFTLTLVVKIYFGLNGSRNDEWIRDFYPYLTIVGKPMANLSRFWVLFTHMFVEADIFSLFSNFIWLWLFGFIIEDLKGQNRVLPLFIINGLICGIVVLILTSINPDFMRSPFYYGMRNSILAIAAAAVFLNPSYKVFTIFNGGFSVWILGVIFLLIDLSTRGAYDLVNLITIITSVLVGYLYNKGLGDTVQTFFYDLVAKFQNKKPVTAKPKAEFKVVDMSEAKLNEILDKINEKGMKSLTPSERAWLENYNNKNA